MAKYIYKGQIEGMLYKVIRRKVYCIDLTALKPFWIVSCFRVKEFMQGVQDGRFTAIKDI